MVTGLTGVSSDALWCVHLVLGEVLEDVVHVSRGSLHVFRGSSFGLLLWWFCSLCTDGVEPFFASPVRSRYELCSQVDLVSVLCLDF